MPTPTVEKFLYRIQTDPNASSDPTCSAFFGETVTIGDKVFTDNIAKTVTWQLMADTPVTVGDQTMTYAQVSAFVTAIAYQELALAETQASDPEV